MTASDMPPANNQTPDVWVLTNGAAGMENQGLAVAEALGLPFTCKRVRRTGFIPYLPTPAQILLPWSLLAHAVAPTSDPLAPPWPKLVIAVGRQSIPLLLAIKRRSAGRTLTLYIHDPKLPLWLFDLVAAPLHDGLKGKNVVTTLGAPHRITPHRLAEERDAVLELRRTLKSPHVTVLIGGKSRTFAFDEDDAARLGHDLARFAATEKASLLVTMSRRTGAAPAAIIARALESTPARIWTGDGANPYFTYLAAADAFIVTSDSVNMITEAAGTGKPVYVYPLRGQSRRLARFHRAMEAHGATRRFDGALAHWSYPPVNDTQKIVEAVRAALRHAPNHG